MFEPDPGLQGPFLARLTADEVTAMRVHAVARHFARGATMLREGEVPGRVLVIERGFAKVIVTTDDGKEVVLSFRGPGDVLGEVAALSGLPRVATVRVLEPVDAIAIAVGDFEAWLEQQPRVALELLKVVIGRLREADQQQFEFTAYQT